MTRTDLENRLCRVVGNMEAFDLLETPQAELNGATPQSYIDAGNLEPVMRWIQGLELAEAARMRWINPPQSRSAKEVNRLLKTLDELNQGGNSR